MQGFGVFFFGNVRRQVYDVKIGFQAAEQAGAELAEIIKASMQAEAENSGWLGGFLKKLKS